MLNQFRTLLLNLSYDPSAPEEHIPASFDSLTLPPVLSRIYAILFPPKTSRYFKRFLAQNYLSLLDSANLSDVLTAQDTRISYSLDTDEFFKIHRNSNPIQSNPNFPIFITGSYINSLQNSYFYDQFDISQIDQTNNVSIYSPVTGLYHDQVGTSTSAIFSAVPLTFQNGITSDPVNISTTGISFVVGGTNFTGSTGKTWSFIVESPYVFDFQTVYTNLSTSTLAAELFAYRPDIDVKNYQNIWQLHYNPVYKFAAFIAAYVTKVNSLI